MRRSFLSADRSSRLPLFSADTGTPDKRGCADAILLPAGRFSYSGQDGIHTGGVTHRDRGVVQLMLMTANTPPEERTHTERRRLVVLLQKQVRGTQDSLPPKQSVTHPRRSLDARKLSRTEKRQRHNQG